jgi:hypothetical protein
MAVVLAAGLKLGWRNHAPAALPLFVPAQAQ